MIDSNPIKEKLCQGLVELGLNLTDKQIEQLLLYLSLLKKWNQAFNLTAIDDPDQMVPLHILDSLAISAFIHENGRYIDIGTGAGLPGIPLAITHPTSHFTLLDTNSKKTRFLTQACHELGLNNINVVHSRVEQFKPEQLYDGVLSRAFTSLPDMIALSKHLCKMNGTFLAMKGLVPELELELLSKHYSIKSQRLKIPFLSATRHIICIINQ
jgi:16S rRNA (guanine527-N7)-methyltransferase